MFKTSLFVLTSFCLLVSCKNEKAETSKENTPPATAQAKPGFEALKHSNKALVLINNLSLFSKDKQPKTSISGLYGLIIDTDSISTKRFALTKTDDRCKEHNFVYLNSPKITGWAYGQDVFEYARDSRDTVFTLQGTEFKFYATKNFSIGPSDDDGLTFCGGDSPVVLYNSKTKAEAFVPMQADTLYSSRYLVMDDHDGWLDKIKDVKLEDNKLLLTIHRQYQEGTANITIEISLLQNGYQGKVVHAIKHDPEY